MKVTTTFLLKTMAGAALLLAPLAASAVAVGDVVDVTDCLKGKVIRTNGGNSIYLEVYQNPDNRPKGALEINYMYPLPTGDHYIVEKLAESAFRQNSDLTSVKLNAAITAIPARAFQACVNLASVSFDKGQVDYIGSYAFEHTSALTSFDFSGVTFIGQGAFWVGGLTSAELPEVEYINAQAFREMKSLTKVVVGEKCKLIDGAAFASDEKLAQATLNYGLQEIGLSNFSYSYELNDFVIPATVKSVKSNVTTGSPIQRIFILTPDFMDFCDESNVLLHPGLKEIYALDELLYEIDYYLSINKATKPNLPSIKAKSLSELVEVIPVPGEAGRFTVKEKSDDVWRLKIRNSAGDFIYPVADGQVYEVSDGKVMLDYEVNTINHLRYTVTLPEPTLPDDPSGVESIGTEEAASYRYYTLQGVEISTPAKGTVCIRRNLLTGKAEKVRL